MPGAPPASTAAWLRHILDGHPSCPDPSLAVPSGRGARWTAPSLQAGPGRGPSPGSVCF